uniref:Uncharacterized AAA domain-containing protein ycf46 n=1 Tax=Tolypiocladia glomerulata TaxID=860646 RepID=A0A1Z1MU55_9FLOR|nr:hypothetical protein [Tolypiocladia glomerulata]ARW69640.1 hypothetical protein [Tolypiocladia glomerulata]
MHFETQIKEAILSSHHIIYVLTEEEERLETILVKIRKKLLMQEMKTWNFVEGYSNQPKSLSFCEQNPLEALKYINKNNNSKKSLFFLKDFCFFFNDISINRQIKNTYYFIKKNKSYIIMSGTEDTVPVNLKEYIKLLKLPLPGEREIKKEINNFLSQTDLEKLKYKNLICKAYTGLSIKSIKKSLKKIIKQNVTIQDILKQIYLEKAQRINEIKGLKFYNTSQNKELLGGLNELKKWLNIRSLGFSAQANNYGLKNPKGILLVGIQGTGKSLSARTISQLWNIPLLKLDIGKIFASALGESEYRIEKIIDICNTINPCILWIDEIDKIFNKQTHTNDSGTTQRVTNIFLTWLSEKRDNVFILATANKIEKIPIEMMRKGRFDEIFFVDLPQFLDRMIIFKLHLKRVRPITWNKYNIYYFSKISKGFSGAEIEQAIAEAMYIGFNENREFTSKDIIVSIKKTIPVSRTNTIEIFNLRKWGHSGKTKLA